MTETRNRLVHLPRQLALATVPARTLAVLVAVGTDAHRFDRLMDWLETWYAARPDRPTMLVQHGSSRGPAIPGAMPFLAHEGLLRAMAEARIVVTHGGPATITEARRHGHVPIVVARDPAYQEHVDDHQMRFAARMAGRGVIRLCTTAGELSASLERGLAYPEGLTVDGDAGNSAAARAAAVAQVGRIVDDLIAARGRRFGGPRR
jgi:UDP-N-acetylglucosamine transferase subunit ALG13